MTHDLIAYPPLRAACLLLFAAAFAPGAFAAELDLPLELDYRILEQTLDQQMFSDPGRSAQVYADHIRCNTLELSEPRVSGTEDGHIRIRTTIKTRTGTPLGQKCLLAKFWTGVIDTVHEASVDAASSTIAFKVVDSDILNKDERHSVIPRVMRKWIVQYIHPRLDAVAIDLQPAIIGIRELVTLAVTADATDKVAMASSLKLKSVRPAPAGLDVVLSLDVPAAPTESRTAMAGALTEEELQQWDAAWQAWDAFATWLIKTLGANASPQLLQALADTLLEARYDLRDALALEDYQHDPVRDLFLATWERLAPLLHESQLDLPGAQALSYATFISAANALSALDRMAPYLGMRLDKYSLRRLARLLVPAVNEADLDYSTAVDPALRRLLGLEPEFDGNDASSYLVDWLIRSAQAAEIDANLVRRLNGWVPSRQDIDDYLHLMAQLLDQIALAERGKDKVPVAFVGIYDTLLRATAWQESCWRQYIEQSGTVLTIQSSAGSVGLMQVNKHVWNRIYDIDRLTTNIGYNARAGNEILVHYLVDYAIKKHEDEVTGDADNLARATYAIYNGGPRHLSRYRNPDTKQALKDIDDAFWKKYLAIQREGPGAVKQCYQN